MIRTLHHMADAPAVLGQVRQVMETHGVFILEFANKLNLKSILRFWLGKQTWSPFTLEPVEFVVLNFDFHPKAIREWLSMLGFKVERTLTVSHFRIGLLKRLIPTSMLVFFDSLLQWTGAWWQLTPSVFLRAALDEKPSSRMTGFFKCPRCGAAHLEEKVEHLRCRSCGSKWGFRNGIYDFREPVQ